MRTIRGRWALQAMLSTRFNHRSIAKTAEIDFQKKPWICSKSFAKANHVFFKKHLWNIIVFDTVLEKLIKVDEDCFDSDVIVVEYVATVSSTKHNCGVCWHMQVRTG